MATALDERLRIDSRMRAHNVALLSNGRDGDVADLKFRRWDY